MQKPAIACAVLTNPEDIEVESKLVYPSCTENT
jgi:hypothetical protein